jgi:HEAT repeat protein
MAAVALGRIGDSRAVQPLLVVLRRFKDPGIATVLGNLGYAEAVNPMITELELLRTPMTTSQIDKLWGGQRWRDIYFYYVANGLGKLGDARALPILEWARDYEQEPVLKGRSIGYKAARAIERIRASQKAATNQI